MTDTFHHIGISAEALKEWAELCHEIRNVVEPHLTAGQDARVTINALAAVMSYVVSLTHPSQLDELAKALAFLPEKIVQLAREMHDGQADVGSADVRDVLRRHKLKIVEH